MAFPMTDDETQHPDGRARAAAVAERLLAAGLRPTRQRLAIAEILFDGVPKHVSAESVYAAARQRGAPLSLATVYNALNQFTEVGLLRELVFEPGRSYFDTNTEIHHHIYNETTGDLDDIAPVQVGPLPTAPPGTRISRIDVIVRVVKEE